MIHQLDVITQHVNVIEDGEGMGMDIVMRCVEMEWLLVENNVTALLSAVTDIVYVCKTTHTTMRVGHALIVGMGMWKGQRSVTRQSDVIIQHANAQKGIT